MAEAKPIASLSSGLLARKGAARPAMKPQGFGQMGGGNLEDLGWDGERFVDLDEEPVETLFKLYPWEWLVREEFGQHLLARPARLIEPAWKPR